MLWILCPWGLLYVGWTPCLSLGGRPHRKAESIVRGEGVTAPTDPTSKAAAGWVHGSLCGRKRFVMGIRDMCV